MMTSSPSPLGWLESELIMPINHLLNLPVLKAINSGVLNREHLLKFGLEYSSYCEAFPRMLALAASNIPDDETRMNLVENLWEEHGSGNINHSHRSLFKLFLCSLGWKSEDIPMPLLPSTIAFVEGALNYCRNANFLASMSFLGPGAEMFTHRQYEQILHGLGQNTSIDREGLEFWRVHIGCDDEHYLEMANAIARWSHVEGYHESVRSGAMTAIEMETAFWVGLEPLVLCDTTELKK
jgi:pyrroloquinoline quinone (PQQ) biosynthesis protein C